MPFSDDFDETEDSTFFSESNTISSRYNSPKLTFVDTIPTERDVNYENMDVASKVIMTAAKTHHQYTTKIQTEYFMRLYNEHIKELDLFHEKCYLQTIKAKFFTPLFERIANMSIKNRLYTDPHLFAAHTYVRDETTGATYGGGIIKGIGTSGLVGGDDIKNTKIHILNSQAAKTETYEHFNNIDDLQKPGLKPWLSTPLMMISQTWNLIYKNCVIPLQIIYDSMEKTSHDLMHLKTILSNHDLLNTKVHYIAFESSRLLLGKMYKYITEFYAFLIHIYRSMHFPLTESVNIFGRTNFTSKIDTKQSTDTNVMLNTLYQFLFCLDGCAENRKEDPSYLGYILNKFFFPEHDTAPTSGRFNFWLWSRPSEHEKRMKSESHKLCFTLFEYMYQFEDFIHELSNNIHMKDIAQGVKSVEDLHNSLIILEQSPTSDVVTPIVGSAVYEALYRNKQRNILTNSTYLKLASIRDKLTGSERGNASYAYGLALLPNLSKSTLDAILRDMVKDNNNNPGIDLVADDESVFDKKSRNAKVPVYTIEIPESDEDSSQQNLAVMDNLWLEKTYLYRMAYTSIDISKFSRNDVKNNEDLYNNDAFSGTTENTRRTLITKTGYKTTPFAYLDKWVNGSDDSDETTKRRYRYNAKMIQDADGVKKAMELSKSKIISKINVVLIRWKITDPNADRIIRDYNSETYDRKNPINNVPYYKVEDNDSTWKAQLSSLYTKCDTFDIVGEPASVKTARKLGMFTAYGFAMVFLKAQLITRFAGYIYSKIRQMILDRTGCAIPFFMDMIYGLVASPYRDQFANFFISTMGFAVVMANFDFATANSTYGLGTLLSQGARLTLGHYLTMKLPALISRILLSSVYRAFMAGLLKVTGIQDQQLTIEILVDKAVERLNPLAGDETSEEEKKVRASRMQYKKIAWPIAEFIYSFFSTITDLVVGTYIHNLLAWVLDIFLINPLQLKPKDFDKKEIPQPSGEEANESAGTRPRTTNPNKNDDFADEEDVGRRPRKTEPEIERGDDQDSGPRVKPEPEIEDAETAGTRPRTTKPSEPERGNDQDSGPRVKPEPEITDVEIIGTKPRPKVNINSESQSNKNFDVFANLNDFMTNWLKKSETEKAKIVIPTTNSSSVLEEDIPVKADDLKTVYEILASKSKTRIESIITPSPTPIFDAKALFLPTSPVPNSPATQSPVYSLEGVVMPTAPNYDWNKVFDVSYTNSIGGILATNLRNLANDKSSWEAFIDKIGTYAKNSSDESIKNDIINLGNDRTAFDKIIKAYKDNAQATSSDVFATLDLDEQLSLKQFVSDLQFNHVFYGKDTSKYVKDPTQIYIDPNDASFSSARFYELGQAELPGSRESAASTSSVGTFMLLGAMKQTLLPTTIAEVRTMLKKTSSISVDETYWQMSKNYVGSLSTPTLVIGSVGVFLGGVAIAAAILPAGAITGLTAGATTVFASNAKYISATALESMSLDMMKQNAGKLVGPFSRILGNVPNVVQPENYAQVQNILNRVYT